MMSIMRDLRPATGVKQGYLAEYPRQSIGSLSSATALDFSSKPWRNLRQSLYLGRRASQPATSPGLPRQGR